MRLLIAGGGTGGHLFPGVALAEALRAREPEAPVLFVGTDRGIEARVLPKLGWDLSTINITGIKTGGVAARLAGVLRLPRSLVQSERIVREFRPSAVIGVGGYASGPAVLAARLMGIPTAIIEQNSIPGVTNKILGKLVDAVFLSFEETRRYFADDRIAMTGTPIRADIVTALRGPRPERADGQRHLLVFGGSQGARALNETVPAAVAALAPDRQLQVLHQTGVRELDETRARYAELGIQADCRAFIDDMASAYLAADLVVCRAGAGTVAELAVAGAPAVLVPYPHAADDHQTVNARELAALGAAEMLPQSELSIDNLANSLGRLFTDSGALQRMRSAMKGLARPDAADCILDWCAVHTR